MNEHTSSRRDDAARSENAPVAERVATEDVPVEERREPLAGTDPGVDHLHDDALDGDEDYAPVAAPRGVVQISRPLFLAMVTFGVLAILALGTATALLALDRRDGNDPVVATVNGETIRRSEYDKAVAENSGEEVLDGLVLERLVTSEAKKRNITVNDEDAARLLDEQKQQFNGNEQAYQAALTQAGLTEEDLIKQLRLREMLRRMVSDTVQVSDQEAEEMYRANADRYAGQTAEQAKEQIKSGLQRQKENSAIGDLLDQVRADAKIETHLPGKS